MSTHPSPGPRAAEPLAARPAVSRPVAIAALIAGCVFLLHVGDASAQDERFQAWLLGFAGTYTLEVHGDVEARKFELPEIPLCPVGRCADIFTDGGNYNFGMRFEVLLGREETASNTKIKVSLVLVNLVTGDTTRLRSISKKVKNLTAEKAVDLDIRGITNEEQLVALVSAKRGLLTAGARIETTVFLTFNDPR